MVREIVYVQVGQYGNQIGNAFCDTMRKEHKLEADGKFSGNKDDYQDSARLDKIDEYFKEAGTLRFVGCHYIVSPTGRMFKPDNFGIIGPAAKEHYTERPKLIDEVKSCDCPQRFQITHSLGDGTGSGLGTLLLMKIRDNYPDRITATLS